jgi:uncharacterized protein (TIGR03437 family)
MRAPDFRFVSLSLLWTLTGSIGTGQVMTTITGNGSANFSGDGGPATQAAVNSPFGVAVDPGGNVYIADYGNNRVRKINASGVISTVAGCGAISVACISAGLGDGGPALAPLILGIWDVVTDSTGNYYFTDSGNARIRKVDSSGNISTVAGGGKGLGDGGAATSAQLGNPVGLAIDAAGNLYVAEVDNNRVRKISVSSGVISTIAGTGTAGFSGDGGVGTSAQLNNPHGVGVDAAGNVYIADTLNYRIRKVNTAGTITTVAGNGEVIFTKDGVAATTVALTSPWDVKPDGNGNFFISEWLGYRIRKVDASGTISTFAGTGTSGNAGDGGAATSAQLGAPNGIALDSAGNLYISDSNGNRVHKVAAPTAPAPAISANGVVNGASFAPGIVAGSWATITGTNLASLTDTWNGHIVNGALPTTLDGVTVTIGGKQAYLNYISSTQINLVVPTVNPGATPVTVTTAGGTSSTFTVTAAAYGPAFFTWPGSQAVATRQDFSFAAKAGTFAGTTTVAAKPGDVIILWGTGFGPTTPAAPSGVQVPTDQTYATSTLPTVRINSTSATVYGAALAPGYAGLYQVAIQVPSSLADGDWPLVATIGGVASPSGVVLSVKQ